MADATPPPAPAADPTPAAEPAAEGLPALSAAAEPQRFTLVPAEPASPAEGSKRRNRRNRRSRGNYDEHLAAYADAPVNDIFYPPQTLAMMAVAQIEYYFSADSLCREVFLRSRMDEAGYVPVAMVCNFERVLALQAPYDLILEQLEASETLELDRENEKIRLAGDGEPWRVWLFPNGQGGLGVPLYVKGGAQPGSEPGSPALPESVTLSPAARPFVPSAEATEGMADLTL